MVSQGVNRQRVEEMSAGLNHNDSISQSSTGFELHMSAILYK